jgi:hypothetical protein
LWYIEFRSIFTEERDMPKEKDLEITFSEYRRIVQSESTPLSSTDKYLQKEDKSAKKEKIQESKADIDSVVIDKP